MQYQNLSRKTIAEVNILPQRVLRLKSGYGLAEKRTGEVAYELPTRRPNVPTRQQHRRPRPLVHRLGTPMLRHIRIHITRTTAINQYPTLLPPLLHLQRNSPRHTRDAALAHGVGCTGPALLFLLPLVNSFGEGFHELGDVADGLGLGERGADFLRVFGV